MHIGDKVGFPNKAKIKKILKKLEKVEGTLALPEHPTPLQKFRFDLQQKFVAYKQTHQLSQKEMSVILEIDESKISKILHNRLEEFSTDRLINLYGKLNPKVRLKVS